MTRKTIISILVGAILFSGCEKSEKENSGKTKQNMKKISSTEIVYPVKKAVMGNGNGYIDVDGTVEANDTIGVFVDKKLKVEKVHIQEGDYVEKGQLLITFDNYARNSLMRNLEKEKLLNNEIKRNYNIAQKLLAVGGSTENEVLKLKEELRISELNIENILEDIEKTAEKIESPVTGTVTTLYAQDNYSVNTDDSLLEIADLSDLKIILEVPEYDVMHIKENQKIILKPEVFEKKKSFSGVVEKISKISKVSETSGENVLEIEAVSNEPIPFIVPGFKMSARIYLSDGELGILVPTTSILNEDNLYYIFTVDKDGDITKKEVEFKPLKGNFGVVTKGLQEGEMFLISPTPLLKTGDKINFEMAEDTHLKNKRRKKK